MHLDNNFECFDRSENPTYTYSIGSEDVVIQWELMAADGIITHEAAVRLTTEDAEHAKASLARRRPSLMSEVNRLTFMRNLSLHGLTEADLASARTNRGFAQRMIDYTAAGPG